MRALTSLPACGRNSVYTPQRIVAAILDITGKRLVLGFEKGEAARIPLGALGLPRTPRPVWAAPDEYGGGVVLFLADGSRTDCGADLLRLLASGASGEGEDALHATDLAGRVSERLRAHRMRLGLSQRAMAGRLGMAPPNYHRLEAARHRPTVETLLRVAEVMGVPLARLVGV